MPLFDETKYFIPLMLIPWLFAIIYDKKNRWQLAILIPLVIILVDQSGLFIKKTVLRPRPWAGLDPNLVNHLVGEKGRNYSFPSNHAANITGLAMVFSSIYYRYSKLLWTVAGIVMFSRVYIGVHYPADIIAGWVIGTVYGLILIKSWKKNKVELIYEKEQDRERRAEEEPEAAPPETPPEDAPPADSEPEEEPPEKAPPPPPDPEAEKQAKDDEKKAGAKEKSRQQGNSSYDSNEKTMAERLGLQGQVTKNEIKKAYKNKMKEYHPDKVESLGEKLKEVAEEESKKIIEAFDYFKKKHNIS